MPPDRREFLAVLGGASLAYAFRFPAPRATLPAGTELEIVDVEVACSAAEGAEDYSEWIILGRDRKVTVFTGRCELGQGLKTVIIAVVSQGLEVSHKRIKVVMGDTSLCPDDGPTTGSCATKQVGWGFWLACAAVRDDLLRRTEASLGVPTKELHYRRAEIIRLEDPEARVSIFELGSGEAMLLGVGSEESSPSSKEYKDRGLANVNARAIVTGALKYAGDINVEGCLYGAFLTPPYHPKLTKLLSAELSEARAKPGVFLVERLSDDRVFAVGESYKAVRRSLESVVARWSKPARPRRLSTEKEIRAGAKLVAVIEEKGDVNVGLATSAMMLSETYMTQYASQSPIETSTAVATVDETGATLWVSSQNPFKARELVAQTLGCLASEVRVIAMPVGGGFGGKISSSVNAEAALLSKMAGRPVKLIYSRRDQFQHRSRFKASCIIDITSGLGADGKLVARQIDLHQDSGKGTVKTYTIPNVLTRLFNTDMPVDSAVMRGTSYVQNCFAIESHTDSLAHKAGIDPIEFRKLNVSVPAFRNLLDTCAEMIRYNGAKTDEDHGVGFAIVNHGGHQLGAVGAKVSVDRSTGEVLVVRICGAFDIGTVISRKTATADVIGAIIWGLGYALQEEIELDGHRTCTSNFAQYRIPRFSDVPPIEIAFLDNFRPGKPRGCGEMPVIPTIGAIANAVFHATGARIYRTPITPKRVLKALSCS